MSRRWFLLIMTALIYWSVTSAGEKKQITNLFEGDSLAVLNEEQNKLLDSAIGLLIENDSIVVLPQEINQMIGDTAKVCYLSYPDWQSAYFQKSKKNKSYLYVPTYAETPFGIIGSEIFIELEEKDSINCFVETILPIDNDKGMNTMYIASNIQGDFLRCKAYKVRNYKNKTEEIFKDYRKERLGYYKRYDTNIYNYRVKEYSSDVDKINRIIRYGRNMTHGLDTGR
ncbi:MAG: hypothetical protein E7080_06600 [Bacteroidales bacterium]|nr:hypothetical protein [Bacteroidales bacterium]